MSAPSALPAATASPYVSAADAGEPCEGEVFAADAAAVGNAVVHEVCRRLSCETGWPIRYVPEAARTAAPLDGPATQGRQRPLWQSDLRDGVRRSGWLRIDRPERRTRDASFLHACRVAEAVVPTLSIVLAQPCEQSVALPRETAAIGTHETLGETLSQLLENLLKLTGLRSAGFFLRTEGGDQLHLRAESHRDGQTIPHLSRQLAESPFDLRAIGRTRSLIRRSDSDLPPELWDDGDAWLPPNCQLGVCEPVRTSHDPSDVLGTLWAFDRRARRLTRRDLQILESVAARLGQVLEKAVLHHEAAERQRLTDDLEAAVGNTPDELGHFQLAGGRVEIATRCHAHSSVGGDLCEVLAYGQDKQHAVIGLGDASGHSLPAALVMATVRGSLRALALDETLRIESDAIMQRLNNALVGVAQSHQFMTMVAGHLDAEAGRLTFTNAGHPLPVIVRGDEFETPPSHGMLLGVFEDADYECQTLELQPGDILVLYTDGLAEAQGPCRSMFRTDGVAASTLKRRGESAVAIRDGLWNDVEAHLDGIPCDDDRSVLVLKVHH